MSNLGVAELFETFSEIVGFTGAEPWVYPPVTDHELRLTEEGLGWGLPGDLVELFRIHNGGMLFDSHEWIGCRRPPDGGIVTLTTFLHESLLPEKRSYGGLGLDPGPRSLYAVASSQVGILYDVDNQPGRLLYLDMLSAPAVIPLARSLTSLLDCYVTLAREGFVTVGELGPLVDGPLEAVREVFVTHGVAHALQTGIAPWLSWPGSASFSIGASQG